MNGEWIKKLENAVGSSERIIAVNIDIRGFTEFSQSVESVDVGLYIKKIYIKILTDYFPDVAYSKPMGDGLFLVMKYDEHNLKEKVNDVVDRCIKLDQEFENLIKDDPMIPFETPTKIGIGITRGASCCISVNGDIIDYSGKILNHASRLMEKARPSGIVCDYISFFNLMEPELKELFVEDEVCLRGISENEPVKILLLSDKVKIMETDRRPINEPLWEKYVDNYTCSYIKSIDTKWFKIYLKKKPVNIDELNTTITLPKYVDGKRIERMITYFDYKIKDLRLNYGKEGPNYYIDIDFKEVKNELIKNEVKDDDTVEIKIVYPI